MKKIYAILITLLVSLNNVSANARRLTYERLIASIAYVESKHETDIVSSDGRHVGYLQISKELVRDCNKILGYNKYNYRDRYSKQKSIEMFHIIQKHYNPKQNIRLAMRLWNEGTSAIKKKPRVTKYMRKVMDVYDGRFKHLKE